MPSVSNEIIARNCVVLFIGKRRSLHALDRHELKIKISTKQILFSLFLCTHRCRSSDEFQVKQGPETIRVWIIRELVAPLLNHRIPAEQVSSPKYRRDLANGKLKINTRQQICFP